MTANAQTPQTPGTQAIIGGITSLALTTASASVILPASNKTYPVVSVLNDGTAEAFVRLGNSSIVVTATNGIAIPPGATQRLWVSGPLWTLSPATYLAGITAAGTSTLHILQANGP